jgi:hypothetical protein
MQLSRLKQSNADCFPVPTRLHAGQTPPGPLILALQRKAARGKIAA